MMLHYAAHKLLEYLAMKWLKKKIIGWAIDAIMDAIISALRKMANNTTSSVDDKLVETLDNERATLKLEIQDYLNGVT